MMKMNPLLFCLLILFQCFFICKSQIPIPAKIDGFVYKMPSVWGESVVVEAFLDPVCPDSRDSWPPLKQALDYYSGRLSLVVHPFPLPYHSNAFIACRSLHIANKLNASSVYPLLELFFKTQEKYYNAPTYGMTRASVVADMTKLALTVVGEKYYNAPTYGMTRASVVADMTKLALTVVGENFGTAFQLGFNDSSTDEAARISFKYGCSRGVTGAPVFFVNGMPLSNPGSPLDYNQWRSTIDPLLAKNKS